MRIISTAILGVIAIALGVVIYFVDREPEVGDRAADLAQVLVRFDSQLVDSIAIEKGVSKTTLVKRGGVWFFSSPETDRVDGEIVNGILDQINHLDILDEIERNEDLTPQQMGVVGDQAIQITFSGVKAKDSKERVENSVILGAAAPRTNSLYAKRKEQDTVFVVDGNLRQWVEQPLGTLRDRKIVGAPVDRVVQLVIRQSTGEIALQRKITSPPQPWAIASPLQTWASEEKLDKLLADLGGLEIREVLTDANPAEAIPNPLPDDSVVLQMMVFGFDKPLTLYLKKIESDEEGLPLLEARVSDRPAVYRLRSSFLESLPANANEVRDRTLARLQMPYMDSIVIQSRIHPLVYLKNDRSSGGQNWQVKLNNKLVPANFAEVVSLIDGINETAILDFASDNATDLAGYGLAPPARRITFKMIYPGAPREDGSSGPVQEIDRVLNLGWKEGEEQRLFANFEGEKYVYELDPSFGSLIPTHPIKWRSLNVLSFNQMRLQSITRDVVGMEKLKLTYDYRRDSWEAVRNGVDVRRTLDVPSARRLRDRLGALTADGWYLSLGPAYEALKNPSSSFSIVVKELDRATGDSNDVTYQVKFAESTSNIYFGQIEGSNDVFYLDHSSYSDLIRPVTSGRAAN